MNRINNASPEMIKLFSHMQLIFLLNRNDKERLISEVENFKLEKESRWLKIYADSKEEVVGFLNEIDPRSVTHWFAGSGRNENNPLYNSVITRYLWVIFACGQGSKNSSDDFINMCRIFAKYEADAIILSYFDNLFKTFLEGFEGYAIADKLSLGSTKFSWISDIILESLAESIESLTELSSTVKGIPAKHDIINLISDDFGLKTNFLDSFNLLNSSDKEFLSALSIKQSSERPENFELLLHGNKPINKPLCLIGDKFIPINYLDWKLQKEKAVFKLIRDEAGGSESGRLFEKTVELACKKVSPGDIVFESTKFSKSSDANTPNDFDEIDLIAHNNGKLIMFADAKCLIASDKLSSAGANIESQLIKYSNQINTRYASLQNNKEIYNSEKLTDTSNIFSDDRTVGLLIPLHDYSGFAWRNEVLSHELEGKNVLVIPIQSMLFVLSLCRNSNDYSEYLQIRKNFSKDKLVSTDELEFIIYWLNPANIGKELKLPSGEKIVNFIAPHDLPLTYLLKSPSEELNTEEWRKFIYESSIPSK